jgi:hypothetical protein
MRSTAGCVGLIRGKATIFGKVEDGGRHESAFWVTREEDRPFSPDTLAGCSRLAFMNQIEG